MIALSLIGMLFAFIAISMPVAMAMGLATLLVMLLVDGAPPVVLLARSLVTAADSFPLIAVPLFVLAGDLMQMGGMSRRIVGFAYSLVGHVKGGLAYVNVLACCFFAAISGSSPATVAAIGSNMVPEMEKVGYPRRFSSALTAAGGMVGVMIPPSIPFIIYGVSAEVSIGQLFMAGIVPGVLFGVAYMATARLMLRHNRKLLEERTSFSGRAVSTSLRESIWALLVPVIILGGIYGGIFTPTEAGGVAVIYAIIVGVFVYGDIRLSELPRVFARSAATSGQILILVVVAGGFGQLLTIAQVPNDLAAAITDFSTNPLVLLLLVNLLLLVVGMFMETIAAIIILTPLLLPVAAAAGVDPIHFGVIMTVNLAIGFCTPPLGVNLFVASSVSGVKIMEVSAAIIPYFVAMIALLLAITYLPDISLLLAGR
ncbi:Sialic acid TRAP transporter permease protein SiaT [Halomonas sp. THAF12]|uniref:TRAP transporter large permease n=1 Tax=Halomonas sp. THAF12 TaxID=2587849 RepID=UPI0012696CFC|nr:TRAP transporter large permease [Halomonas sp. THAF12]QFT86453.1 Sialic acid TRAP transporter permease protein SiaT [Halomonas sp. THAF12]